MKVIFFGTGTSEGVPLIQYKNLDIPFNADNPKNWRTRSSIHVEMDSFHIQVDAAQEFRIQCLQNDTRQLDLFILTHEHSDHVMGMDDLRGFCKGRQLPVYSTKHGLQRIKEVFPYAITNSPESTTYPAFDLIAMPPILETPGGTVKSFILPHGTFSTLGLVFEEKSSGTKFAYFCDCKEVTPEAIEAAKGVSAIGIDGLRMAPLHHTHMCIPEAIEVAQKIKAPNSYITHTTMSVDYDDVSETLPPGIHLAYDGLKLSL